MEQGKLLKRLRKERSLSQGEVAEFLGYRSGQFFSNIERGSCEIPLPLVLDICKLFGCQPGEFKKAWLKDQEDKFDKEVSK